MSGPSNLVTQQIDSHERRALRYRLVELDLILSTANSLDPSCIIETATFLMQDGPQGAPGISKDAEMPESHSH